MKKLQKIELLNFEGPVLMAYKNKDTFIITDQWKEIVDVLSTQEIKDFINGKIDITDSNKELGHIQLNMKTLNNQLKK